MVSLLDRVVPVKADLRYGTHPDGVSQLMAEIATSLVESLHNLLLLGFSTDEADEDAGIFEVGGGVNIGYRHEVTQARVFYLALQEVADLITD